MKKITLFKSAFRKIKVKKWVGLSILSFFMSFSTFAQQNIAPLATVTADGTGGGGCMTGACSTLNDLNFGTCNTQQMWISTSTPPSTTIGADWIQWDFPFAQTFDSLIIHHGNQSGRDLTGATVQSWDGSQWVTQSTFSNLPQQCVNRVGIGKITASRFRITAFQMTGAGQQSNPNFREIEILQAANGVNDAAVTRLDSPTVFCAGRHDVWATIQNMGINQIDSVNVFWEINGTPQPSLHYKQLLDTFNGNFANRASILLGSYNFQGPTEIKVYTSMPNGVVDTSNFNDTLIKTVGPSLYGYFSVDKGQATGRGNYNSFKELIDDLNAFGVCGPIVVDVMANSGPYNEILEFKNIVGTSPTNTIRINGNGNSVEYSNTSTDRQLLTLDGTKHLTIDNLNFKSLDATYGWGALITGGAAYDSIMNCEFNLSSVTSSSSANSNGITFSGSATSATTTGSNGSDCYIGNNHIKATTAAGGPYYAITIVGNSDNNSIMDNTIENFYFYGIYLNGAERSKIAQNEIHRSTKTSTTTFYGIYTTGITPNTKIIANKIHTPGGPSGGTASAYGMYILGDGEQGKEVTIANNLVYNWNQGGITYGIYLSTAPYVNVYHNTISFDEPLSSASANYGIYAVGTNTDTEIKNNLVSLKGGGTGTKYGFYYSTAASINDVQKNNFYVNSTQSGTQSYGYYTTAYTTQASFHAAYPNLEVGSPVVNPQFINPLVGNFSPNNPFLVGAGENLLFSVPDDINGDARMRSPTIGAYEKVPTSTNDAALLGFTAPEGNYCPGSYDVKVIVVNAGMNDIDSVEVHWTANGVSQPTFKYYGKLVPITASGRNSDTVAIGNTNFPFQTPVNIVAWVEKPNNIIDTATYNDTTILTFEAAHFVASATSDTICIGNSARLNLSPSSGYNPGDISWQYLDGSTWRDFTNSDKVKFEDTTITSAKWYRVNIGGVNGCYTDSIRVDVNDPQVLSTTAASSSCGPSSLTLNATASAGSTVSWYDSETSSSPLDTGNSFTTPFLTQTDTFYVAANAAGVSGSGGDSLFIGPGTTCCIYPQMFTVYVKEDLIIDKMAVLLNDAVSVTGMWDVYYRPDDYTRVAGGNTSANGWTQVVTSANIASAGTTVPTEIASGLNIAASAGDTISFYVFPTGPTYSYHTGIQGTVIAGNNDLDVMSGNRGSALFSATTSGGAPPIQLTYNKGCEGSRTPVIATINSNSAVNVNLGGNHRICEDSILTLDAGNPADKYVWSTGDTSQTIQVNSSGTYSVVVSNSSNCEGGDTIMVTVDPKPVVDSIKSISIGPKNYIFSAAGVRYVQNYFWDFGDNTSSTSSSGSHTYTQDGNYTVTLIVSNDCGSDTVTKLIQVLATGIDQNEKVEEGLLLYPNPANEAVYLKNATATSMQKVEVFNTLGQKVITVDLNHKNYYTLDVSRLSNGIYHLKVSYKDGSWLSRKVEVSR